MVPQIILIPPTDEAGDNGKRSGADVNGWTFFKPGEVYGTDYIQRALITRYGLGCNIEADAVYPSTKVDSTGQTLNGANNTSSASRGRHRRCSQSGMWAASQSLVSEVIRVEIRIFRHVEVRRVTLLDGCPDGVRERDIRS